MLFTTTTTIILAIVGCSILSYAFLKRLKKEDKEPPYDPYKDDPIIHIRNKLFFEIPVEKIFLTYFVFVALSYIVQLIFGIRYTEIDLVILYMSGITMFLGIYKMAMSVGVANKFTLW